MTEDLKQPHSWSQLEPGMDIYVSRGRWNYYHKDDWQIAVLSHVEDHTAQIVVETNQGADLIYATKLSELRIEG